MMFLKTFTVQIIIANLIAWPLGYYFMTKWLSGFVYRTDIDPLIYLLSGAFVLVMTLLTVGYHTLKAATRNPVKALKYE